MKKANDNNREFENYNLDDTVEVTDEDLRVIQRAALKERAVELLTQMAEFQADTPLSIERELDAFFAKNTFTEEELAEIHRRVDKNVEEMDRRLEQSIDHVERLSE